MKWLMFGRSRVCFDEAGDGGGGGASTGGAQGGSGGEGGQGGAGGAGGGADGTQGGSGGSGGEFPLGKGPNDGEGGQGGGQGGAGAGKGAQGEPPKTFEEKDYLDGIKKDTALLGNDDKVQLDGVLIKAMAPTFKELGLSPEQANKLANAFAKAQVDDAKGMMQQRLQSFQKMRDEAMQKYTKNDFAQIDAGINKWFKPGGTMNQVIRNTELAADPEFLALMHHLGAEVAQDGAAGAGAGSGGSGGSANTFAGISGLWK